MINKLTLWFEAWTLLPGRKALNLPQTLEYEVKMLKYKGNVF